MTQIERSGVYPGVVAAIWRCSSNHRSAVGT